LKATEYLKLSTKIVDLPSGIKARVRQVKVMPYIISGQLPNVFAIETGQQKKDGQSLEEASELLTNILCDAVCHLMFDDAEMLLVNKPQHECSKDELSYSDTLSNDDANALFAVAFVDLVPADGGAGNLKSFRTSSGE